MWDWVRDNQKWVFSGIGVAVIGALGVLLKWLLRKGEPPDTSISQKAHTGDSSPVRQLGTGKIDTGGGDLTFDQCQGLDGREIIMSLSGELATQARRDGEEITELKQHLAAAERRAEAADKRGDTEARRAREAIRETGDTGLLLRFLMAQRDRLPGDAIQINREISAVAYLRGDIDVAESALDRILQALPDDLDAINRKGHIYRLRGDLQEAEQAYRRVLGQARTNNDLTGQAMALGNLGLLCKTRGDLDKAEEMDRRSLAIYEQLGCKKGTASLHGNLGILYKTRGDLDKAREYWTKARGLFAEIGMRHMVERVQGSLDELEK